MKEDLIREVELVNGVSAELKENSLTVKGPKGEVTKNFPHPLVSIVVESGKVIFKVAKATKREKKVIASFEAHVKNMVKGVQEPHLYKVKICSGHFPMNVTITGDDVTIKNFLGESVPRKVKLIAGTNVKVEGTEITISSPNKEIAGQNAAKIESLCRITNRDRRIFQDGCYITHKSGKDM